MEWFKFFTTSYNACKCPNKFDRAVLHPLFVSSNPCDEVHSTRQIISLEIEYKQLVSFLLFSCVVRTVILNVTYVCLLLIGRQLSGSEIDLKLAKIKTMAIVLRLCFCIIAISVIEIGFKDCWPWEIHEEVRRQRSISSFWALHRLFDVSLLYIFIYKVVFT